MWVGRTSSLLVSVVARTRPRLACGLTVEETDELRRKGSWLQTSLSMTEIVDHMKSPVSTPLS